MANELHALLGILIIVIMIYFFLYSRSKIIGAFALFLASFSALVPFGETDYELIAWFIVFIALTIFIITFALEKMGASTS